MIHRKWDLANNNSSYSHVKCTVDDNGYLTLAINRCSISKSSMADLLNVVQAPSTLSAIYEVTKKLRAGTFPSIPKSFNRVIHIGHSFGSVLTYELVAMYPHISDGIVLIAYSQNGTYLPATSAGVNWQLAHLDLPARFSGFPSGYLTWANVQSNLYGFFSPVVSILQCSRMPKPTRCQQLSESF